MRLLERISWLKTRVQDNLFPHLKERLSDPLTQIQKDLVMSLEVIEIEKHVSSPLYHWMGRTPEDRQPIARAFVAKAVYDLPDLMLRRHAPHHAESPHDLRAS